MDPAHGSVPSQAIEVRVAGERSVPVRVWRGPDPRAAIVLVHGLGEHGGRYAALASALVGAGLMVFAPDLPGHGMQPGARGDLHWTDVRDRLLPALLDHASHELGDASPRFLFGHSLGGVMALDHALAHPERLAGLVLSSPGLRIPAPPAWKVALARLVCALAPAAGFPNGLDPAGLSRDAEVVQRYRTDPLVHDRISPRTFFAFRDAAERGRRGAQTLRVPTFLVHGMADRLVDPRGSLEFAAAAPADRVRFTRFEQGAHELFNDLDRDAAIAALVAWLHERMSA